MRWVAKSVATVHEENVMMSRQFDPDQFVLVAGDAIVAADTSGPSFYGTLRPSACSATQRARRSANHSTSLFLSASAIGIGKDNAK
jgi:hypothetical protein